VDEDPTPLDVASQRQQAVHLRAALKTLPAKQKEVVELAFVGGLSHSKIAERLNLPLGTVKSRMRLAFGPLNNALAKPEFA